MKNQLHYFASLFILSIALSCGSPQKLVDSGKYDDAIRLATKRIKGKKDIKKDYVLALEEAFQKGQERDMRRVQALLKEGRRENWEKVNIIYNKIGRRQEMIEPFLPLYAEDGYEAEFRFIPVADLTIESRGKTAEYLYDRAKELLDRAENTGDRDAAREALSELNKIDRIYQDYKDKESLKDKALFLGTEKWLVRLANRSNVFLPENFERTLMKLDIGDLNSTWRQYSLIADESVKYAYHVVLNIENIDVSPELEKERQFDESREIEDGFDYVLDDNGNVMKDTSGNDIKIPKKVFIKATVLEIHQLKSAVVNGSWDLLDGWTNDLLKSEPMSVETSFENYASTLVGGDKRALSKDTRRRLGNQPQPFPSDEIMLLDAADILKERMKDRIKRFRP
jgi:tetratricopeptide (TPR) repeat protein